MLLKRSEKRPSRPLPRPAARAELSTGRRARKLLRELLTLAAAALIILTARASLADHYVVPTGSMLPTVQLGDRVVVNKAAYGLRLPLTDLWLSEFEGPRRGDVVVLESPETGIVLLKRVVALPGDEVAVRAGRIVLNGQPAPVWRQQGVWYETLDGSTHRLQLASGGGPDVGPVRVPADRYLVLGDNRGGSHDGRMFGWVTRQRILGRVEAIYLRQGSLVWQPL